MIYAHKGALVTDVIHTGSRRDGVSSSVQIMGVSRGRISVKGKTALPCDGFNILQNNGEATVHHLHFHIVPRYGNEPIAFESHKGDMDVLADLASKLKLER